MHGYLQKLLRDPETLVPFLRCMCPCCTQTVLGHTSCCHCKARVGETHNHTVTMIVTARCNLALADSKGNGYEGETALYLCPGMLDKMRSHAQSPLNVGHLSGASTG
eukprot:1033795-Amphidinium_carterae.2